MDLSKYGSVINYLNCTWENAISSYWVKYPNTYSQHVLSEDVLDRKVFSDGKLYTRRLLTKTNPMPSWGSVMFKSHLNRTVNIVEESMIDPATAEMKVYTWNTTYVHMMDVQERTTITPSEHGRTRIFKEGWIDSSLKGFRKVLRKFGYKRWQSNVNRAFLGYQSVVNGEALPCGLNSALKEKTLHSLNEAKDKAKLKAIKLAAKTHNVQS